MSLVGRRQHPVVDEQVAAAGEQPAERLEPHGRQTVEQPAPVPDDGEMLPCTPMSPPGRAFRSRTNSTSPPSITSLPGHSAVSGVEVATYFGTPLMKSAKGWMSLVGQKVAHA